MDKQIVVPPYNGIKFKNEKEQTVETCKNMSGFQRVKVARCKRVLYDAIYVKFQKIHTNL